jgi:hypothetical protein
MVLKFRIKYKTDLKHCSSMMIMRTSIGPTPVDVLGEIREYLKQRITEPGGNSNMKTCNLYRLVSRYKKIYEFKINLVNNKNGDLLA